MNIVTITDCPLEAFRAFRGMSHGGKCWYAVRLSENSFRVYRGFLSALNEAPDSRVWSFQPANDQPQQISGRKL